jgi:hypothetical protein
VQVCVRQLRPTVPPVADADLDTDLGRRLHALMMRCWAQQPEQRPNFKEIAQKLIALLAEEPDEDLEEMLSK